MDIIINSNDSTKRYLKKLHINAPIGSKIKANGIEIATITMKNSVIDFELMMAIIHAKVYYDRAIHQAFDNVEATNFAMRELSIRLKAEINITPKEMFLSIANDLPTIYSEIYPPDRKGIKYQGLDVSRLHDLKITDFHPALVDTITFELEFA